MGTGIAGEVTTSGEAGVHSVFLAASAARARKGPGNLYARDGDEGKKTTSGGRGRWPRGERGFGEPSGDPGPHSGWEGAPASIVAEKVHPPAKAPRVVMGACLRGYEGGRGIREPPTRQ